MRRLNPASWKKYDIKYWDRMCLYPNCSTIVYGHYKIEELHPDDLAKTPEGYVPAYTKCLNGHKTYVLLPKEWENKIIDLSDERAAKENKSKGEAMVMVMKAFKTMETL